MDLGYLLRNRHISPLNALLLPCGHSKIADADLFLLLTYGVLWLKIDKL
jgi:hypothetical protein